MMIVTKYLQLGMQQRDVEEVRTCVSKHSDHHVGAVGVLIHAVGVVALCPCHGRLRRHDSVQLAICPVRECLQHTSCLRLLTQTVSSALVETQANCLSSASVSAAMAGMQADRLMLPTFNRCIDIATGPSMYSRSICC